MTKKSSNTKRGARVIIFVLAAIVLIFATIVAAMQFNPSSGNQQAVQPGKETIEITGTILCLPHKDTSGPQTMECAYGLKDEGGKYYGLSDTDKEYRNISGVPMNTKVIVSGTLKKQSSETYPTEGLIEVTNIER